MEGVIKYVDKNKKFGFIHANDADHFFHFYNLDNKRDAEHLTQGMQVQFSESMGKKGPRAEEIKLLGESRVLYDAQSEPFRTFKGKPSGRVDTHETSVWEIRAEHRYQKEARRLLAERAHLLGANAVSHLSCDRKGLGRGVRYVMKGTPCKVSEKGIKLKPSKLSIDGMASRKKRNAIYLFLGAVAVMSISSFMLSKWHPFGWALGLGALMFWNNCQWLTQRKSSSHRQRLTKVTFRAK